MLKLLMEEAQNDNPSEKSCMIHVNYQSIIYFIRQVYSLESVTQFWVSSHDQYQDECNNCLPQMFC